MIYIGKDSSKAKTGFFPNVVPKPFRASRTWQTIWLVAIIVVLAFIGVQIVELTYKCLSGEPVTTITVSDDNNFPNIAILVHHDIVSEHLQRSRFATNVIWHPDPSNQRYTEILTFRCMAEVYENTFSRNPVKCRSNVWDGVAAEEIRRTLWKESYDKLLAEKGGALNLFKAVLPPDNHFVTHADFEMNQRAEVVSGYPKDFDCVGLCVNYDHNG